MPTKRVADMTPEEHAKLKEQRKRWKKKKYIKISELSEPEKELRRKKQKEYARKKALKNPSEKLIFYRNKLIYKINSKILEQINRLKNINKIYLLIKVLNKIMIKKRASEKFKKIYWSDPEKYRAKRREWINRNRDKKRLADRGYNAKRCKSDKYKIECNKRYRLYRQIHKKEISEKRKIDRQLHPEKYREQRRKYRERHIDKEKQKQKKIQRELSKRGFMKYETFASKLTIDEDPIRDKNGCLMVRDFYTKEYFYPKRQDVYNRIMALKGKIQGEHHLYATKQSKANCPVYHAHKRPRFTSTYYQNPARDPAWRNMIISRANGHCEQCGKECDSLIAHHMVPVATCTMLSADIDNGIALCPECHREAHSKDGCRLHELAAEKREQQKTEAI